MHNDADMSAETSDGRWLTYDQLAALRHIDKPSAVKLATRNRWQRRKGNTGQMQVCVPMHWFERAQDRQDRYAHKSTDIDAESGLMAALEDAVAGLRGQLDVANARVDAESARADRSDAALTGERVRADALRERLDEMQRDLKASEAIAIELRADLDAARAQGQATQEVADAQARLIAARRSRGLLARLRAAVRGE